MGQLPSTDAFRKAHSYCAYCPKLCRSSCAVATVEGRETTTPWGKMGALHHVDRGALELRSEHAALFYACSGCSSCTEHCEHRNPVADTLRAARRDALASNVAPPSAAAVVSQQPAREARAASAARAIFAAGELDRDTEIVFVPGCTSCVRAGEAARDGLALSEAVAGMRARVVAEACCGLPLLEAGDRDGFLRAARRFFGLFARAKVAFVDDPGCLHALRAIAPLHGVVADVELKHLSELAAERLELFEPIAAASDVRYHDACRLGRGLGIYDPPRRVLRRILGRAPLELSVSREAGICGGSGGQLPRIYPATADAMTDELIADHRRGGGGLLSSACPATISRLNARGEAAIAFSSFVLHALRP